MHWHVCTTMLLLLMINFNIMKNILFLIFYEHKNSKLNQFNYISKVANFRVLHVSPSETTTVFPPTLFNTKHSLTTNKNLTPERGQ